MLVVVSLMTLAGLFVGDNKVKKPDFVNAFVPNMIMLLLQAWVVSECFTFALAPYNKIEIGYWQAFFAMLGLSFLKPANVRGTWTEWLSYRHSQELINRDKEEKRKKEEFEMQNLKESSDQ
jgi:hypothetical protein